MGINILYCACKIKNLPMTRMKKPTTCKYLVFWALKNVNGPIIKIYSICFKQLM